jgi:hypothetical protein
MLIAWYMQHASITPVICVPVVTTQPEASSVGIGAVVWLMAGLFVFIVGVPLFLPVCLFVLIHL